ncbi:MAG: adenylyltransferase/cytidyltransferase family protein [Nanoarchaeota archaeon]|nr:adenylyltransferase/cytidyltransferase family protein [Nanoarchaeota archaeon]
MTYIDFKDLPKLREEHKDKKLVFCTGSFDLVHAGHALFFEDCKRFGDKLIVIVAGDKIIQKHKGLARPIMNQRVRQKMIDSLKPVDYTVLDDFTHENSDPLYAVKLGLEHLKPDFYVINEDAFNIPHRKELCEKSKTQLKILKRFCPEEFNGISASKIIETIKARILGGFI